MLWWPVGFGFFVVARIWNIAEQNCCENYYIVNGYFFFVSGVGMFLFLNGHVSRITPFRSFGPIVLTINSHLGPPFSFIIY